MSAHHDFTGDHTADLRLLWTLYRVTKANLQLVASTEQAIGEAEAAHEDARRQLCAGLEKNTRIPNAAWRELL